VKGSKGQPNNVIVVEPPGGATVVPAEGASSAEKVPEEHDAQVCVCVCVCVCLCVCVCVCFVCMHLVHVWIIHRCQRNMMHRCLSLSLSLSLCVCVCVCVCRVYAPSICMDHS
jgi:hypothetical protein